jgi:predicted outer membrane repeat protein
VSRGIYDRTTNCASVFAAALAGVVVLLATTVGSAATFTVSKTSDSGSGFGSLRDAIVMANASRDSTSNIVFSQSLKGATITLDSTLPAIIKDLTITGPDPTSSAGITISGNNRVRIMEVQGESTVSLQYLTLTNGSAEFAGAVLNLGNLTVANCTFSANRATQNGGAISNNAGSMLILSSTFTDNRAAGQSQIFGGAIINFVRMTIENSTFIANQVTSGYVGGGSAIANLDALMITNTTFSDNKVVDAAGGQERVIFGGAIFSNPYSGANSQLMGTLFARSVGRNCFGSRSTIADKGYNLSDDGTCGFSGTSRNNVTDIDLALSLGNNGGPTETLALTSVMSAAVDLIPPLQCPKTDQRGFLRPAPGQARCDAGAFELGASPP